MFRLSAYESAAMASIIATAQLFEQMHGADDVARMNMRARELNFPAKNQKMLPFSAKIDDFASKSRKFASKIAICTSNLGVGS